MLPLAWLVKLWTKAPIFMIIHGIEAWKPRSRLVDYCLKSLDGIISVSQHTMDLFQNWANVSGIQHFILPNSIAIEQYGYAPKNSELLSRYGLKDKTVLMTLGRLDSCERYKGFDEMIDLMPQLRTIIPNLTYLIVGEGHDQSRLEAKVRSLNIQKQVVFTGFVAESEKAEHYRLADTYVMPSKGEGFGIVFLEAMACGIPVVASKLDGSREAVRDGLLGILVNPNEPEEIKAGILEALQRPRGIEPLGLDYFYYENFELRCHEILHYINHPAKS
jgi:glycosyltransferase involved in cell wall biosynthesis